MIGKLLSSMLVDVGHIFIYHRETELIDAVNSQCVRSAIGGPILATSILLGDINYIKLVTLIFKNSILTKLMACSISIFSNVFKFYGPSVIMVPTGGITPFC